MRKHPEAWPNNKESDMSHSKACTLCKQILPLSDFGISYNKPKSRCKKCLADLAKKYRKENPEKQALADRRYKLKNPGKREEIWHNYYSKNKKELLEKGKIYRRANRPKVLAMYKRYKEENKEQIEKAYRAYRQENPEVYKASYHKRRALIAGSKVFQVTRKDIKKILSNPCTYCGSNESISIDHVIPLSRSGDHSIGNLTSACFSCNSSKNSRFITEWKYYA